MKWNKELLTIELAQRIAISYSPYLRDGIDFFGILDELKRCIILTSKCGYILIQEIIPGLRATIHGGPWAGSTIEDSIGWIEQDTKDFINNFMTLHNLEVLLTKVPEHLEDGHRLLKSIGFNKCGLLPCDGNWNGEKRDSVLYAYYKEERK